MRSIITSITVMAALAAPAASMAASTTTSFSTDAAMRKGIRDYGKSGNLERGGKATASRIKVSCKPAAHVGDKAKCTGTFRLTLVSTGAHADYQLTTIARVLRLSPSAYEYRVAAKLAGPGAHGLPRAFSGFSGFLQRSSN
jgi:hypothetical protein